MLTAAASTLLARLLSYAILMAGSQSFDAGPGIRVIENLTAGSGPASEARIAALNETSVAVGWCVAAGDEAGVYLRLRNSFVWDAAARRVTNEDAVNPRDLAIALDSTGAIHLVWTDLDGPRRRVFYAALNPDLTFLREPMPLSPVVSADADYPQIAWDDAAGLLVVWQSAMSGRYGIEVIHLDPSTLDPLPLPSPSGVDRVAMSPQIIGISPPTIAWHEILDASAELRVARLDNSGAWSSWMPEGLAELARQSTQPSVRLDGNGAPILCWSEDGSEGDSSIRIARANPAGVVELNQPDGDHRQAQLVVRADGSASIAWQVFSGAGQSVEAAETNWDGSTPSNVRISPPTHRFASDPSHEGRGEWSVVVWTDNLLDGGSGAVGFAEIHWAER